MPVEEADEADEAEDESPSSGCSGNSGTWSYSGSSSRSLRGSGSGCMGSTFLLAQAFCNSLISWGFDSDLPRNA